MRIQYVYHHGSMLAVLSSLIGLGACGERTVDPTAPDSVDHVRRGQKPSARVLWEWPTGVLLVTHHALPRLVSGVGGWRGCRAIQRRTGPVGVLGWTEQW
jgi:hypothetical protein